MSGADRVGAGVLLAALALAPLDVRAETYVMPLIATVNAPAGAKGAMRIVTDPASRTSNITLKVAGLYPNTLYTIWTAFGYLPLEPDGSVPAGHSPPQCSPAGPSSNPRCPAGWSGWAGFPALGHTVAPTARIGAGFTDGIGPDPGATFRTDSQGTGSVKVMLNYDITTEAPIGNSGLIRQTVRVCDPADAANCADRTVNITGTSLRKFIADYPVGDRPTACANYAAAYDPDVVGAGNTHGFDARLWQCVDPATGLPRIHRLGFEHFRIANHVDGLTHGFIGGNEAEHVIDMVGRRCQLTNTCP